MSTRNTFGGFLVGLAALALSSTALADDDQTLTYYPTSGVELGLTQKDSQLNINYADVRLRDGLSFNARLSGKFDKKDGSAPIIKGFELMDGFGARVEIGKDFRAALIPDRVATLDALVIESVTGGGNAGAWVPYVVSPLATNPAARTPSSAQILVQIGAYHRGDPVVSARFEYACPSSLRSRRVEATIAELSAAIAQNAPAVTAVPGILDKKALAALRDALQPGDFWAARKAVTGLLAPDRKDGVLSPPAREKVLAAQSALLDMQAHTCQWVSNTARNPAQDRQSILRAGHVQGLVTDTWTARVTGFMQYDHSEIKAFPVPDLNETESRDKSPVTDHKLQVGGRAFLYPEGTDSVVLRASLAGTYSRNVKTSTVELCSEVQAGAPDSIGEKCEDVKVLDRPPTDYAWGGTVSMGISAFHIPTQAQSVMPGLDLDYTGAFDNDAVHAISVTPFIQDVSKKAGLRGGVRLSAIGTYGSDASDDDGWSVGAFAVLGAAL